MDRRYVIENDVVDRYVRGDLSSDEERAFEEFYLTDDWTQQVLTEVIGLKRALDGERGEQQSPARIIELPVANRRPQSDTAAPHPRWATAASLFAVAAMAGGAGFWAGQFDNRGGLAGPVQALGNLQRVELIETRGTTDAATFELDHKRPLLIEAETGYAGDATLTARVTSVSDGQLLASLDGMQLDDYGRITTVLPQVAPGSYRLELVEEQNGTVVASFDFEVN